MIYLALLFIGIILSGGYWFYRTRDTRSLVSADRRYEEARRHALEGEMLYDEQIPLDDDDI